MPRNLSFKGKRCLSLSFFRYESTFLHVNFDLSEPFLKAKY